MGGTPAHGTERGDPEIFAAARHVLDLVPTVPGTVRVHVESGVATLTGSVRLPSGRADAEDAVRTVPGVRGIVNHITVAPLPSPDGFEAPDV